MFRPYRVIAVIAVAITLTCLLTTPALAEQSRGQIFGVDPDSAQVQVSSQVGGLKVFVVPNDCHIRINGNYATIYDLRAGDQVVVDYRAQGLWEPIAYSIQVRR